MTLLVERGAMTSHSRHEAPGSASPRVKQFVMQPSDGDPQMHAVMITLHRASSLEFRAICEQLRAPPGVKAFRDNWEPA